jgi:hypothetical protein
MYCKYLAIVGQACGEGGVVEDELFTALHVTELLMEGTELRPWLEHPLLLGKEKSFPSHTSSMARVLGMRRRPKVRDGIHSLRRGRGGFRGQLKLMCSSEHIFCLIYVVVLLFSIFVNAVVVKLPFVFAHVVAAKEPLESSGDDVVRVGAVQRKSTSST